MIWVTTLLLSCTDQSNTSAKKSEMEQTEQQTGTFSKKAKEDTIKFWNHMKKYVHFLRRII